MRTSLKNDITNYLRVVSPEWRTKGAIERFAQEKGYNAENGTRRTRELVRSGMLVKDPESKYARYKYAQPVKQETFSEANKRLRGKHLKQHTLWR